MWYITSQQKSKAKKPSIDIKIPAKELAFSLLTGPFLQARGADKYRMLMEGIVDYLGKKYGTENINLILNNLGKYKQEALFIRALIEESGIYDEAEKIQKTKFDVAEDMMKYAQAKYPAELKLKITPNVLKFQKNLLLYDKIKDMIEKELQSDTTLTLQNFINKLDELANKERIIDNQKYTLYEISKNLGIAENQLGELADDSAIIKEILKKLYGISESKPSLMNLVPNPKFNPTKLLSILGKIGTGASVAELAAMPSSGNINLMRQPWVDTGETKEVWFKNHKAEDINEYLEPVLEGYLKQEANRIKLDSSIKQSNKLIEFNKLYSKYFILFGSSKWDEITKIFMQNVPQTKIHPRPSGSQPDLYSAFSKSPFGKK